MSFKALPIAIWFLAAGVIFSFQNCNKVGFQTEASEMASGADYCRENPTASECVKTPAPTCQFNGQTLKEGQQVTAYLMSSVGYGQLCQSQARVCRNGVLSGSYPFASCSVGAPASCLFNGQTIAHGQSVQAYLNSTVAFGNTCQPQTRVCDNGVLSGTYQFSKCTVGAPADCQFNGQQVKHGSSVMAYPTSTVPYGQTCKPETRTCYNGTLTGSYTYGSCAVGDPAACQFNGQTIPHGGSVKAYVNSSVVYGKTCTSETRLCTNGVLSGTYQYKECSVGEPAACLFNGQQVAHGQSVVAYLTSSVPYNSTCSQQTRTCTNGTLSGSYTYASCAPAVALSCQFNGQQIAHGQSVTAYLTSSVAYGATCSQQSRVCTNGTLSGSYAYATCSPAAPASCLLGGMTIAHGQNVVAYSQSSVPADQVCESQTRVCTNGSLSGSYSNLVCAVDQTQTVDISVATTQTYTPFKLLLIVDDSYTMSQNQSKLAANIDSLINPLKGRNVSVKVITTSMRDHNSGDSWWTEFKKDGGATLFSGTKKGDLTWSSDDGGKFIFRRFDGTTETFASDSSASYTAKVKSLETAGMTFELKSTDSPQAIQSTTKALSSYILSLGTYGLDNEQAFCPLLKMFKSPDTLNRFTKSGDSLAVVVITDEDDSSKVENCWAEHDYKFKAVEGYVNYGVNTKTMYAYFTYDGSYLNDGVTVNYSGAVPMPVPLSLKDYSSTPVGECTADQVAFAKQYIQDLSGSYVNVYKNMRYSSCSIAASWETFMSTVQMPGSNIDVDYCDFTKSWTAPDGTSLTLKKLAESTRYQFLGTECTRSPFKYRSNGPENYAIYPGLNASMKIEDVVMDYVQQNYPSGKFFMSFIANSTENACPLAAGQSVGSVYSGVAKKYPSLATVAPICASTYAPALDRISQFGVQASIAAKYSLSSLGVPSGARVLEVRLMRDGVETVLEAAKYAVNSSSEIEFFLTLQSGDKLAVKYAPR